MGVRRGGGARGALAPPPWKIKSTGGGGAGIKS